MTTKEEEKMTAEDTTTTSEKNNLNPFNYPGGGLRASEKGCPVCDQEVRGTAEDEVCVGAEIGDDVEVGLGASVEDDDGDWSDDGYREAEDAETLAALSWESYFDRHG
jgi:hypothetical protein